MSSDPVAVVENKDVSREEIIKQIKRSNDVFGLKPAKLKMVKDMADQRIQIAEQVGNLCDPESTLKDDFMAACPNAADASKSSTTALQVAEYIYNIGAFSDVSKLRKGAC
jgi:hypothetical protein